MTHNNHDLDMIIVTAWNNGLHVYGIALSIANRNRVFSREWSEVFLLLEDEQNLICVKLTRGFWNQCPELRSVEIGYWMIKHKYAPWQNGLPPKFVLIKQKDNIFYLKKCRSIGHFLFEQ